MNSIVAALVGGVLAAVTLIGGVNAYQGSPEGVSPNSFYAYSDE